MAKIMQASGLLYLVSVGLAVAACSEYQRQGDENNDGAGGFVGPDAGANILDGGQNTDGGGVASDTGGGTVSDAGGGTGSCQAAADCTGQPTLNCDGRWVCANKNCMWECVGIEECAGVECDQLKCEDDEILATPPGECCPVCIMDCANMGCERCPPGMVASEPKFGECCPPCVPDETDLDRCDSSADCLLAYRIDECCSCEIPMTRKRASSGDPCINVSSDPAPAPDGSTPGQPMPPPCNPGPCDPDNCERCLDLRAECDANHRCVGVVENQPCSPGEALFTTCPDGRRFGECTCQETGTWLCPRRVQPCASTAPAGAECTPGEGKFVTCPNGKSYSTCVCEEPGVWLCIKQADPCAEPNPKPDGGPGLPDVEESPDVGECQPGDTKNISNGDASYLCMCESGRWACEAATGGDF